MKKPVKIALGLAGALLALILIALLVAGLFIDSIARKGIEAGASYALEVNTKLDKANVGIFSGTFAMNGLSVDNPKGFNGQFLKLGSGGVAVSLSSLTSDTVVLPKLSLANLDVDLERNASGANYKILLDNLKRLESGQKPKEPAQQGPSKKFKINEISITDVNVHLDLVGGPAGLTKVNVPIHEIKLTNVGSDGSGVDLPQLTSIILEAVLAAAVDKGGGLIPADINADLKANLQQLSGLAGVGVETVGKVGEQVTKLGGDLGKAAKDIQNEVQGTADQLKKGLGGLLQGPQPEKKSDK
jgi:hypothetical protein